MSPPTSRRVVSAPAASVRRAAAAAFVRGYGAAGEVVVVGASLDAAQDLARDVAGTARRGATFGQERTTLGLLAGLVAAPELAARGLAPVGPLPLEALCARLVHDLGAHGNGGRSELGRFAAIGDRPGLPRALARTMDELRTAGVDAPGAGLDADLAHFARAYADGLAALALADRALVYEIATDVARDPRASSGFFGRPIVLLDVAVHTAREAAFVAAVAARAPAVFVTVPTGDDRTRGHVVHALGVAAEETGDAGAGVAAKTGGDGDPAAAPPAIPAALARLQSGLFARAGTSDAGDAAGDDARNAVTFLSAPGESRECVEIARAILREAEAGTPFDRMAVLLRGPAAYRAHVEEAFRRARIPLHFARGSRRPDPSGRALVALLACAAEGLSARRFAEYLSLGEVPDADAGGPPPPRPAADRWVPADEETTARDAEADADDANADDTNAHDTDARDATRDVGDLPVVSGTLRAPRRWERLLVDAAVIGGHARWERRLAGLRESLLLDRAALDPDDATVARITRDLDALDALRTYALPLVAALDALPREATWGVWIDALGALATRALRRPDRVLAVLAELAPMATVGPVSLAAVRLVLEPRLTELVVRAAARRGPVGRVFVGAADEARGLAFDVVFVPGLAEKLFPQKICEDPILPDSARAPLDAPLRTNADRAAAERLALRLAVGAATRRLVASYPRIDLDQSRPRTPSFYGLEILRAAEGRLPGFAELARRAGAGIGAARLGWPAPDKADDAIDEAEHDLALLESILRRPEAETVGTARYLLSANVHLARALRFRAKRWLRTWSGADGLVDLGPEARAALDAHAFGARSYSPTALQNYAACPYRFVLSAVHRLAPREEPEPTFELDPLQKGSLIHEVLYDLHTALRDAGLLPVTPANVDAARAHLDAVVARVAAAHEETLVPAIPRVWDDAIASIQADLRQWLVRASHDPTWVPTYFELSFGLHERRSNDPRSTTEPVRLDNGIALRGSIDLVERRADGAIRATDYKTGKARTKPGAIVEGGKTLQPVFYALTLEKLLPGEKVDAGRLYFCTSVGGYEEVTIPLDGAARAAAADVASAIRAGLDEGFLPAAPEPKGCAYCDYADVCGPYEELRTSKKKRDRLVHLTRLRSLP